jgi:hypothetical protein
MQLIPTATDANFVIDKTWDSEYLSFLFFIFAIFFFVVAAMTGGEGWVGVWGSGG